MGQGVSDIVQRLRDRAYSSKVPDPLCEQAATEIERLRHVVMFGMDALLRNGAVLGRATDHDAAPAASQSLSQPAIRPPRRVKISRKKT